MNGSEIKLNIEKKMDPNLTNPQNGISNLMILANRGDDLARYLPLIQNLNQQDLEGNTALLYAIAGGHSLVVNQLLLAGANPLLGNNGGLPLEYALAGGDQEIIRLIQNALTPVQEDQEGDAVYLTTERRIRLKQEIIQVLQIRDNQIRCKEQMPLTDFQELGKGSFGTVYSAQIETPTGQHKIVIKEAGGNKVAIGTTGEPKEGVQKWQEYLTLQRIYHQILVPGICPNFPMMYFMSRCANCQITKYRGRLGIPEVVRTSCFVYGLEYGSGTLKDYFQVDRSTLELQIALFQILAALHTLHSYLYLCHNDVKAINILFYRVPAGGYWEYIIHGQRFYLPNLGYIFILNDYGVSVELNPRIHRTVYVNKIRNNNGQAQLLLSVPGASLYLREQTAKHGKKDNTQDQPLLYPTNQPFQVEMEEFWNDVEKYPTFEFFKDIVDALNMFIGDRNRTGQPGIHKATTIREDFKDFLRQWSPNIIEQFIAPTGYFRNYPPTDIRLFQAGRLIQALFGEIFNQMPAGRSIQVYPIS